MAAAYGRQRARNLFTPEQQRIMDQGGNYAGYAVVDGHFTYVGEGRTGQEAWYAVHPDQRPPAVNPNPVNNVLTPEAAAAAEAPWMPRPDPNAVLPKPVDQTRERDALALIQQTLRTYGLPDSLADWAWSELVAGKSEAEVLLDLQQRPEFKAEFPEIDARLKANLPALSPGEIVSYRQQARQMMRSAGLPEGFFDSKDDFSALLTQDVSLKELSDRIAGAAHAAYGAPPEERAEWRRLGFGDGDLTALWLDPDVAQPLLEKRTAAAQLSGTAVRTGFGGLNADQALGLAELDVSQQRAEEGFSGLVRQRELFDPLDAGEDQIGQQEQLGATFSGNAQAQARIEARARRRRAQFSGGGSVTGGQSGLTGLGGSR